MLRTVFTGFAMAGLLVLGLMSGCGRGDGYALSEQDEPSFRRGESLMRENRLDEALLAFENVVDSRRDAAESHLELGRIYMDHVKDPISAIYHFRKYLELRPDSEMSRQVQQLIETAKKDFARSLPGDPFGEQIDRLDLLDQLKKVRAENEELRRGAAQLRADLEKARSRPASSATYTTSSQTDRQTPISFVPQVVQPRTAQGNGEATYTVESGDTLSKISQKVYGTTARWKEIFEANSKQLKNPHDLKVGMELVIPKAPAPPQ
jgi:LysM repeat protein